MAGAVCFGLFVILVVVLGTDNEVNSAPVPVPGHAMCCYFRRCHHHHGNATTTAAPPAEDKDDDKKVSVTRIGKLFVDFLTKIDTEDEKKKEDKKKAEEPETFATWGEFWKRYAEMVNMMYNSF